MRLRPCRQNCPVTMSPSIAMLRHHQPHGPRGLLAQKRGCCWPEYIMPQSKPGIASSSGTFLCLPSGPTPIATELAMTAMTAQDVHQIGWNWCGPTTLCLRWRASPQSNAVFCLDDLPAPGAARRPVHRLSHARRLGCIRQPQLVPHDPLFQLFDLARL